MTRKKDTIIVGVTGGIAAFKSLDLVKKFKAVGERVTVVMTRSAVQVVAPQEFGRASGEKVYTELFKKGFDYRTILTSRRVDHIELADRAKLIVVAPATANIIGKLAHGLADDFLTTTILAASSPVVVCASMNVNMWNNPVVQENIEQLKRRGFIIIEPEEGALACGYEGKGRLADVDVIIAEVLKIIQKTQLLKGKKVIVTAGGTAEPIDSVRFITNRSSGKMGVAIADEAYLRGADVILIRTQTSASGRYRYKEIVVETARELLAALKKEITGARIIVHTAAVSDFTVKPRHGKLASDRPLVLELSPQTKILERLKTLNPRMFVVGFKAEHRVSSKTLLVEARKKLTVSHADVIVANDVGRKGRGFSVDTNEVWIVGKTGKPHHIPLAPKREIASKMWDLFIGT